MLRLLPRAGALCAFIVGSAACGGSDDPDAAPPTPTVSCQGDSRLDSYGGELDKMGELGLASFRFFDLAPSPPAKGMNTFHVEVTSASAGDPMLGAMRVDLRMPDHGHGTSVVPVITSEAPGIHKVEPLYLFMPGVWRLEFEALNGDTEDAPLLDSVVLHFCVEG